MSNTTRKSSENRRDRFLITLRDGSSFYRLKNSVSVRRIDGGQIDLLEMGSRYKISLDPKVWPEISLRSLLVGLRRGASKYDLLVALQESSKVEHEVERILDTFLIDLFELKLILWPDPLSQALRQNLTPEWAGLLEHFMGPDLKLTPGRVALRGQENSPRLAAAVLAEIVECPGLIMTGMNNSGDTDDLADLTIVLSSEDQLDQLSIWNQKSLGRGRPWVALIEDAFGGIVTPIFGRNGDPCFECYRMRTNANVGPSGEDYFSSRDCFADPVPKSIPLFQKQLAGRIVLETFKFVTGVSVSQLEKSAFFFDCINHRYEAHEILPATGCTVCRGGFSPAPPAIYSFLEDEAAP